MAIRLSQTVYNNHYIQVVCLLMLVQMYIPFRFVGRQRRGAGYGLMQSQLVSKTERRGNT